MCSIQGLIVLFVSIGYKFETGNTLHGIAYTSIDDIIPKVSKEGKIVINIKFLRNKRFGIRDGSSLGTIRKKF